MAAQEGVGGTNSPVGAIRVATQADGRQSDLVTANLTPSIGEKCLEPRGPTLGDRDRKKALRPRKGLEFPGLWVVMTTQTAGAIIGVIGRCERRKQFPMQVERISHNSLSPMGICNDLGQ